MIVAEPDLDRALSDQQTRLVEEFRGRVDDVLVRRRFDEVVAGFGGARVKTYVPVLAYRLTRDRLCDDAPAARASAR
jgi:hypothetical protein